ncbi:hypothetical protein Poly51_33630 [Rubripirellula tenax]|uniref:(5-formylfuran-3-yl)methyl phosphate synthase n=1 Tax=Rubripirellula tenax TaxID=2528015 RepID=A0A5C6F216_9BACT|nr:(5-formylfuran-3-yl)methyl phosphate synthase [Rubripirellula tenax]TWU54644.1 hypothetical protein Poly51_33630 [Rubripirellula tenax]
MTNQGTFSDPAGFKPPVESVSRQWLVSLRSLDEVRIAFEYPIDILDLKEPRNGPLAPSPVELWLETVTIVEAMIHAKPKLSAALGEPDQARRVASRLPATFDFAKAGPSGCHSPQRLTQMWEDVRDRLPTKVELVAVAYADHHAAESIAPESVFETAKRAGLNRCLIDTFTKDGRSTLDHLSIDRLTEISAIARDFGLWWALAGSIRHADVEKLNQSNVHPDCIGVRGDVCSGDRTSSLCRQKMQCWADTFRSFL